MAIYEMTDSTLRKLSGTTFAQQGVDERRDLQRLLRDNIEIISPDTLVVAEEFSGWEDSKRRIDLLGIDKSGNIVVIELKRTEHGGHMELQAVRYAAMVAAMTFDRIVDVYRGYLDKSGSEEDATESLLAFLDWDEPSEEEFAQDVRIVLASAEFSKELTTSVMWLNDRGLDIRCIRLKPYQDGGRTLLDVQQVIPLPEAEELQVQIREKQRKERAARRDNRDLTRYDVTIQGRMFRNLPKRAVMYHVVKELCRQEVTPERISDSLKFGINLFRSVEGDVDSDKFVAQVQEESRVSGRAFKPSRYYLADEELIKSGGKTWALTKMWRQKRFAGLAGLLDAFPDADISVRTSDGTIP